MVVAFPDAPVLRRELFLGDRGGHGLTHLVGLRPEVVQEDRPLRPVADRVGREVEVDAPGERVRHAQGRGRQIRGSHLGMHPALEVAVAREHGDDVQVLIVHGRSDLLDQRPGVADARRAPVSDEGEPQLVQVRREPAPVEVVGDDPRSGGERRLHPRLHVETGLDRLLGEQAGGEHHARVRRVRTARDRRDHHAAMSEGARARGGVGHLVVARESVHPRGAALGDESADLGGVRVGFSMLAKRSDERSPDLGKRHPVLRTLRARHRRHHRREIEVEDLAERGLGVAVAPEQPLLLRVALHEVDAIATAGERQVPERLPVDREVRRRRPVLRAHVRQRRPVRDRQRREAVAEELHELPDDAVRAEHLGQREHEVGGRRAGRERSGHAHADHDRLRQEHRLAEHRGFRLDASDAPPEHAEPIDHRRVGIGADERVGERDPVADRHHLPEVLQVHLVADAGARWHDPQAVERLLRPAEQGVALAVAPVLELDVPLVRLGRAEEIHLHGVVDDEVHRDRWFDRERIGAGSLGGAAHRGEIDHRGHAGEVLHQHPRRHERDVGGGAGPAGERAHVVVGHVARAGPAEQVLEQDQDGLRQPRDVRPRLIG